MAVVRRDILTDPDVRHAYVHGVLLLKQQETSFLTSAYNIPGTAVPVRAYDLFVIWHHKTMKTPVPPDGDSGTRNAAHRGPVFLPWHRLMLRFMELNLQRVLEDPTFGLPTGTGPSMGPSRRWFASCTSVLTDLGQELGRLPQPAGRLQGDRSPQSGPPLGEL